MTDEKSVVDFRIVDSFLDTPQKLFAVKLAFDAGLLSETHPPPTSAVSIVAHDEPADLVPYLLEGDILQHVGDELFWSELFVQSCQYMDLYVAKIKFMFHLVGDVDLNPRSATFGCHCPVTKEDILKVFDYSKAIDVSTDIARRQFEWVKYVTALSHYETPLLLKLLNIQSNDCRLLEIGGNSGETAWQICQEHVQLSASVLDLPAVCEMGKEYLQSRGSGETSIQFLWGDAIRAVWPKRNDVILFKSMLHDWPEIIALTLLEKSIKSLTTGGRVVIFERICDNTIPLGYASTPIALFRDYYRPRSWYRDNLVQLGAVKTKIDVVAVDLPMAVTHAWF